MDLVELKRILDSSESDDVKKWDIINCLAKDETAIPLMMKVLDRERDLKKEVLRDMNSLLSVAHSGLENPSLNREGFMQKNIDSFFDKYKEVPGVFNCFPSTEKTETHDGNN